MKHYAYNSPFKMKDDEGNEYTLTVDYDDYAEDPRQWDNLCSMICWHSRYNLGDAHSYKDDWFFFQDLCEELCGMDYEDCEHITTRGLFKILVDSDEVLIKSINMYEHSGITVSTSSSYPYNDRWDSCCVGFIYVTKEQILKEIANANEVNWIAIANECIENEMEVYDKYLRGEVYHFRLTKKIIVQDKCPHCGKIIREYEDEDEIDSCSGFYGDCLEENGILDSISNDIKFMEE